MYSKLWQYTPGWGPNPWPHSHSVEQSQHRDVSIYWCFTAGNSPGEMKCPIQVYPVHYLSPCHGAAPSVVGVCEQDWCWTWALCVTEGEDFTDKAQPANSHYDIYRCKTPRGRCMRAVQRPHYFRSKVDIAQNPFSGHGQKQMLKGGEQAWLKLPAACPLGTWPRVWAQLQQRCGAPNFPLISAAPSRLHFIWF